MKLISRVQILTRAFTLIELLIVVAIIAILAAIAVPNFLEAQTRAKVSRVASDLRSYDTGVQSYRIDHNKYPPTDRNAFSPAPTRTWIVKYLTTPVAYIHTAFPDIFNVTDALAENRVIVAWGWDYLHRNGSDVNSLVRGLRGYPMYSDGTKFLRKDFFFIFSAGPDKKFDFLDPAQPGLIQTYDPTNGTISRGDVNRFIG